MGQYQLEYLKKLLLREKTNHAPTDSEMSSVDNHPADAATDLMTVTTDMAIEEFKEDELDKIDEALAAIEDSSYGYYKEYSEEIPY